MGLFKRGVSKELTNRRYFGHRRGPQVPESSRGAGMAWNEQQHRLPFNAGDRVELVPEQLDAGDKLRELLNAELVVIGVTMGGLKVLLKYAGGTAWAKSDQVRRRGERNLASHPETKGGGEPS